MNLSAPSLSLSRLLNLLVDAKSPAASIDAAFLTLSAQIKWVNPFSARLHAQCPLSQPPDIRLPPLFRPAHSTPNHPPRRLPRLLTPPA
jgi:hypothetical protein